MFLRITNDIVCDSIISGFVHLAKSDIGAGHSVVLSDWMVFILGVCSGLAVVGRIESVLIVVSVVRRQMEGTSGGNTVRPNTVAGEAGHVRLERPIDSSSDKLSVHRR